MLGRFEMLVWVERYLSASLAAEERAASRRVAAARAANSALGAFSLVRIRAAP